MTPSKIESSINKMKKPDFIQSFFILCSGADKDILHQCPSEWNKYSGIGATILLTALLAVLSGGYALYTVFNNVTVAVIFGVFWGIVIFNLDRYIVLSLRKPKIPTSSDIEQAPTHKKEVLKKDRRRLLFQQGIMASPRFLIAVVIALTVSKPLELQLFEKRIGKQLGEQSDVAISSCQAEHDEKVQNLNNQLLQLDNSETSTKDNVYSSNPIYNETKNRLNTIETEIKNKEGTKISNNKTIDKNKYLKDATREKVDIYGQIYYEPYKYWAYNRTAKRYIKENETLSDDITKLKKEKKEKQTQKEDIEDEFGKQIISITGDYATKKKPINQQLTELQAQFSSFMTECRARNKGSSDILARLEALSAITKENKSAMYASWVITLLFMLLETAPVIVKLVTSRGPYEETLDGIEYEYYLAAQEKISKLNAKVNELLKRAEEAAILEGENSIKINKQRLDNELKNNQKILEDIAEKQQDLAKIAIEKWYKNELKKMEEEPENKNPLNVSNDVSKDIEVIEIIDVENNEESQQSNISNINSNSVYGLENTSWKIKNAVDLIQYHFKNGVEDDKELVYTEAGKTDTGHWKYLSSNNEILIDIKDINVVKEYTISEINETYLKLGEKGTNEFIELEKI